MKAFDRRLIYLFVLLALSLPIVFGYSLKPARMASSESFYNSIEKLESKTGNIVLISVDWGPQGKAENEAQTAVAIEHLMRKRIPFALVSIYQFAVPFLKSVPEEVVRKLEKELPGEHWSYGQDWVNFGLLPQGTLMIQGMARAEDLHSYLKADANGTPISNIPCMSKVKTIKDISMLIQFTSLVGTFSSWVQFFQAQGYRPPMLHGCTSITIPEAYTYLASGQILGLHEGLAGAAWYDALLSQHFPERRVGIAIRNNTALAVAQILIICLIIAGNIRSFKSRREALNS